MNRMIHDIEYLQSRMSKIDGSAELSHFLLTLVNKKPVAAQQQQQQQPPEPNGIGKKDGDASSASDPSGRISNGEKKLEIA